MEGLAGEGDVGGADGGNGYAVNFVAQGDGLAINKGDRVGSAVNNSLELDGVESLAHGLGFDWR